MARRNPRHHGRRALGLSVVALTAALAGAIAPPVSHAQPQPAPAPALDDLERAKDLYRSAEAAMKDGRFDDAARDYGAAYELSKDPALFFKIGHAHERGGKCDIALVYYARYLRDGKPTEPFAGLTRERIAACGGSVPGRAAPASPPREGDAGSAGPAAPGSAAPGTGSTADTGSVGAGSASPTAPAGPTTGSATPTEAGAPSASPTAGSGSPPPPLVPPTRQKVAWLMGGSALALVTLGGILAYAASSSENDVRDLYAGFAGQPPPFDAQTRKRYNDLIDEGRRYQHLSWLSFGLAGAAAVGTAVLFAIGGEEPAQHAQHTPAITPVVTPRGAGVAVRF